MRKKVLITGCCGFIAGHLLRNLVAAGWDVDGVDDGSSGDLESIFDVGIRPVPAELLHIYDAHKGNEKSSRTLVINSDFTHEAVLKRIKSGIYDVVFHLAANPHVQQSVESPVETHETNVFKTVGLFDACRGNVDRVIFASSAAVYGDILVPAKELDFLNNAPRSPYGLQKLHCEEYAAMFNDLYNTDIVSLRLFNVFGPGQLGNSAYSNVIASWCNNIREGKSLRSDGSGNQTRDFCYIDNVIDAFRIVAEWDTPRRSSIYNVGCGVSISNNNILDFLQEKYPDLTVLNAPVREGDTKHSQANITRINYELNYNPQVHFYDGLEQTLKWWGI
jgi:nucleoside-diphosphate-sugar epimerase